ncbi:hypothetical protein EV1_000444 [Malus domestica]
MMDDAPKNGILPVQTLRNNIMTSTVLALTAIMLYSIIALLMTSSTRGAFFFISYYSHASMLINAPFKKMMLPPHHKQQYLTQEYVATTADFDVLVVHCFGDRACGSGPPVKPEFEYGDDHRAGEIVVKLNGRLNRGGCMHERERPKITRPSSCAATAEGSSLAYKTTGSATSAARPRFLLSIATSTAEKDEDSLTSTKDQKPNTNGGGRSQQREEVTLEHTSMVTGCGNTQILKGSLVSDSNGVNVRHVLCFSDDHAPPKTGEFIAEGTRYIPGR